jgi:hypothetical protein
MSTRECSWGVKCGWAVTLTNSLPSHTPEVDGIQKKLDFCLASTLNMKTTCSSETMGFLPLGIRTQPTVHLPVIAVGTSKLTQRQKIHRNTLPYTVAFQIKIWNFMHENHRILMLTCHKCFDTRATPTWKLQSTTFNSYLNVRFKTFMAVSMKIRYSGM